MYFADLLEDEKEKAKEAGHAEGVAAGRVEGALKAKLESAVTAVKEFNIPLEQVAEKFNVPLEELKKNL